MNKFKVGDIIRCINLNDNWAFRAGLIVNNNYTVTRVSSNGRLTTNINDNIYVGPNCFILFAKTFNVNEDGTFEEVLNEC